MIIKTEKLLKMLYLLLENEKLSAQVLAEKLEVSARTVFRYVDSLSEAGFPIYVLKGRNGGIALLPQFKINNTLVNKDEQVDILASLQSLRALNADDSKTLDKLSVVFKQDPISWVKVDPNGWNNQGDSKNDIGILREAILRGKFVMFNYINAKNEYQTRLVYPYQVIFKDKAWYLEGYSIERMDQRIFKLIRMDDLQLAQGAPKEIKGHKPWLDAKLEQMKLGNQIEVELKFSQNLKYRIFEEFPRNDIRETEAGEFVVKTMLHDSPEWLLNYLLSFGTDLKVLAPTDLQAKMKIKISQMLEKY